MLMTPEVLTKACKDNGGYRQPHLNDQLFLQCRGFCEIKCLEPYVNLKVLWLEQNAIQTIENIEHLDKLGSLFLQNNTIRSISGLSGLCNLRTLNLSHNYISKITGLAGCRLLETLQLSHNRIERFEDMQELWSLPELSSLDISYNKIDDRAPSFTDADVVGFFARIPELSVLYFHGQELPRRFKNYRKTFIFGLKKLTYLDERPVFPQERRTVEAWGTHGTDAEKAEMEKIKQEKYDELTSCLRFQAELKERNKDVKEQREREYAERQEIEKQRLAAIRVEYMRKKTELDHAEYEARAEEASAEEDAWSEIEKAAITDRRAAIDKCHAREKVERDAADAARREAEAAAAIEARNRELEEELARERSKRQAQIDEMTFWVKKMAQDDEAIEAAMQADLDNLLAQLQPPAAGPRQLPSDAACSEPSYPHAADSHSELSSVRPKRKLTKVQQRWASSAARYEKFYALESRLSS